jgi:hypothetical protein
VFHNEDLKYIFILLQHIMEENELGSACSMCGGVSMQRDDLDRML